MRPFAICAFGHLRSGKTQQFFADLAAQLPEDNTQAQRIAQLEVENKIMATQLKILKEFMAK